MTRRPSNKLTIYLIKDRYTDSVEIIKNERQLVQVSLEENAAKGTFYYAKSHRHQPSWITKFFGDSLSSVEDLFSSSANGLLLTKVQCNKNTHRIFAICFGQGRQFLRNNVYEERFGLKVVLNIIDPDSIRKIDKKSMTSVPKDTTEQLTKAGTVADFGLDIEQDLVRAVTGTSLHERFGKTATGKDSLTVTTQISLGTLDMFLKTCYEKYISSDYKKSFDWFDQFSEIKDAKLLTDLNDLLLKNITSGTHGKTWMAVPEIVKWEDIQGFGYSNKAENLKNDINLTDFIGSLDAKEQSSLGFDRLQDKTIHSFDNNDQINDTWSAYECLYCEVIMDSKTYLLSNGKWYEIDKKFVDLVSNDFAKGIKNSSLSLPAYNHKNEGDYNQKIPTKEPGYYCLDKTLVNYGGGHSKIEFCDLINEDKNIIHVKHYGGSSVLSHLFWQGLVSGELFLSDSDFREKVNPKLPSNLQLSDCQVKPNPSDYKIVFAIISEYDGDLDIPFFSKVSFRNARKRLETFGYSVSLVKIEMEK